jgi:hypothetical protein
MGLLFSRRGLLAALDGLFASWFFPRTGSSAESSVALREQLTRAFEDVFADTVPYFGGGGPGYYGVGVENVAGDGSELDVVLTFRSGTRYCCMEPGCQWGYWAEGGWSLLRECLDRNGLHHLPLPTVRRFRGVIEEGAVFDTVPAPGGLPDEGAPAAHHAFEYEVGPFLPINDSRAEPHAAADQPRDWRFSGL